MTLLMFKFLLTCRLSISVKSWSTPATLHFSSVLWLYNGLIWSFVKPGEIRSSHREWRMLYQLLSPVFASSSAFKSRDVIWSLFMWQPKISLVCPKLKVHFPSTVISLFREFGGTTQCSRYFHHLPAWRKFDFEPCSLINLKACFSCFFSQTFCPQGLVLFLLRHVFSTKLFLL